MAGAGRGIDALPGVRVPYRGLDEWTRAVIGMGGTLLIVLAGLLAFWPRRGRTGFPPLALLLLLTLYVVPAVVLDFGGEFIRGALLALLMIAFLRAERLGVNDAPAAGVVAAARGDRRARHRARDRRPPAVVGLRAVGARHRRRARGRLLLEPRLQPAELAARRPRAAARQGVDPRLLEGGRPRRVRRPHLASGPAPAQRGPGQPAPRRRRAARQRWSAADRGHAAQHADRHVRHRRHRDRGAGEGGYPIGGGVYNATSRLGRGDAYSADVYTPRPERAPAARGRHRLRGLAARLPVAVRPGARRACRPAALDLRSSRVDFAPLGAARRRR